MKRHSDDHYTPQVHRQTETIVWIPYGELHPPASTFYLVTVDTAPLPIILYWASDSMVWKLPSNHNEFTFQITAFAHLPGKYKGELNGRN